MPKVKRDENPQAFKHMLDRAFLNRLAIAIKAVSPSFESKKLLAVEASLKPLEMKPRVQLVRDELRNLLPDDYPKALKILMASLDKSEFRSFDLWCYSEFIQTYGLDHLDLSLKAMKQLTPLFTSEFAIRPYIRLHYKKTLDFLEKCAGDKDHHVRRFASEGSRSRLPWGEKLHCFIENPEGTAKILEKLKFDNELYVRKSVANHLNDLTKDNPHYVIKILTRWKKEAKGDDQAKIDWITRHALRTLIKNGDADALKLIGVNNKAKIKIKDFALNSKSLVLGDRLNFSFKLQSNETKKHKIVVDYVVSFVKANGDLSPKVFKLKNIEIKSGEEIVIAKQHHFKPITTRTFYGGKHKIAIQVNGVVLAQKEFALKV